MYHESYAVGVKQMVASTHATLVDGYAPATIRAATGNTHLHNIQVF